jgi:hypothetical protein
MSEEIHCAILKALQSEYLLNKKFGSRLQVERALRKICGFQKYIDDDNCVKHHAISDGQI